MDELDVKINRLRRYYWEAINNPVIRNLAYRITYGAKTDMEKVAIDLAKFFKPKKIKQQIIQ